MDDATQKLVDGLRLDAGDYGRVVRGEIEPGETFSWDQSNVRAWEAADALEAAQRPPISPEVREEMFRLLYDASGSQFMRSNERHSMVTEQRDALLARFSVPSQPLYDEEAIARWLMREFGVSNGTQAWMEFQGSASSLAAALVAALRGGELTREETNE